MDTRVLLRFGWATNPFDVGRVPREPLLVPAEEASERRILKALDEGARIVAAAGAAGAGKTVVGRRLALDLEALGVPTAFVTAARLPTEAGFFADILRALGEEVAPRDAAAPYRLRALLAAAPAPPVLVVDDAHRLPPVLLAALRALAEPPEGAPPRARLVLLGRPDLLRRLLLDFLVAQVRFVAIAPLPDDECLAILDRRLLEAGAAPDHRGILEAAGAAVLCRLARGNPGLLLFLAASASARAASVAARWVSPAHVRAAAAEIGLEGAADAGRELDDAEAAAWTGRASSAPARLAAA